MNNPEIAIIMPTIERDELLISTLQSIIDVYQDNWSIIIVDQNEKNSEEKELFYKAVASQFHTDDNRRVEIIEVPYNSGISYCRNIGVKRAKDRGIPYCLISADSIEFTKSMEKINDLIKYFKRYDLIGLDIKDRLRWEAKIKLIEGKGFELDFIKTNCSTCSSKKLVIYNCDVVRNFFIAKTDTLIKCQWDNNLLMMEHEDFFYRYSKEYKIGYTNHFQGKYVGEKSKKDDSDYAKLRRKNMNEGRRKLQEKYKINGWLIYKNFTKKAKKEVQ